MTISREKLLEEAAALGFLPAMLEKVFHLMTVLEAINRHPDLHGQLALKGGTALNLFFFDLPRLSVDIDLNYVGAADRETMLAERPRIVDTIKALCKREGLVLRNERSEHAGAALDLRYGSALGGHGNLKIDLNFLIRVPLWEPQWLSSRPVGSFQARDILVLDLHELAAGKLAALLSRQTSRDLFDAHELLVQGVPGHSVDPLRLRLAFVVYGGFNLKDWRTVSLGDVPGATKDLQSSLVPLLRDQALPGSVGAALWAKALAEACQAAMGVVLPLDGNESAFLDRLLNDGEIEPMLLTQDAPLAQRIAQSPALLWKALNVRDFKRGVRRNAKKPQGVDEA